MLYTAPDQELHVLNPAAAFLWNFAEETPWAHLDIAGTGWTTKSKAYQGRGATGVGVRLLLELLRDFDPKSLD